MNEWISVSIHNLGAVVRVCVCVCVCPCVHRWIFNPNVLEPEGTLESFVPASYFTQGGPGIQIDAVTFPKLQLKAQSD